MLWEIYLTTLIMNSYMIERDITFSHDLLTRYPGLIIEDNPIARHFYDNGQCSQLLLLAQTANVLVSVCLYKINPMLGICYNLVIGLFEVIAPYDAYANDKKYPSININVYACLLILEF